MHWQSKGQGFDSPILHKHKIQSIENEYFKGVRFCFQSTFSQPLENNLFCSVPGLFIFGV
jgi:hypothetical protein